MRSVRQRDSTQPMQLRQLHRASHCRIGGYIPRPTMPSPSLHRPKASHNLRLIRRKDRPIPDHLRKPRQPCDAMRPHAIAIGLRSQPRRKLRPLRRQSQPHQRLKNPTLKFRKRYPQHPPIRPQHRRSCLCFCRCPSFCHPRRGSAFINPPQPPGWPIHRAVLRAMSGEHQRPTGKPLPFSSREHPLLPNIPVTLPS